MLRLISAIRIEVALLTGSLSLSLCLPNGLPEQEFSNFAKRKLRMRHACNTPLHPLSFPPAGLTASPSVAWCVLGQNLPTVSCLVQISSLWKFLIYSHVNFHSGPSTLRDLIVLAWYYFVTLKNNYRVCLCLFFTHFSICLLWPLP